MAPLRIVVLEDQGCLHQLVRQAARLTQWPATVQVARLANLESTPPSLMILNGKGPQITSLLVVRKLKCIIPRMPILVIAPPEPSRAVFEFILAGSAGCAIWAVSPEELAQVIDSAARGGLALCRKAARALRDCFGCTGANYRIGELSARELQVLGGLLRGRSEKEISMELGISTGTAHQHIVAIYKKLHAHCRREAVAAYVGLKK